MYWVGYCHTAQGTGLAGGHWEKTRELTVIDWFKVSSASKVRTKRSVSNSYLKGNCSQSTRRQEIFVLKLNDFNLMRLKEMKDIALYIGKT